MGKDFLKSIILKNRGSNYKIQSNWTGHIIYYIVTVTIQDANSMVISNAHPNVQSKIWKTSQPKESVNINMISGAVWNIEGITELYVTVGGTPEEIVPSKDLLLP